MNLASFGITYIGVRTAHINEMKQFAEAVLGYAKTHDTGDFVAFTTPQGQRFELHDEATPDKQFYPLEGSVPGFEVPDMDAALAWLEESGLETFPERALAVMKSMVRAGHTFAAPMATLMSLCIIQVLLMAENRNR